MVSCCINIMAGVYLFVCCFYGISVVFCPFLVGLFGLSCCFESSFYILNTSPLLGFWFANIFSQSLAYFFILLIKDPL